MKLYLAAILNTILISCIILDTSCGPAPKVSKLKISRCWCDRDRNTKCEFTQIGYGYVSTRWTGGGRVSCSRRALTNSRRIVYGWVSTCTMSSDSGKFEIRYAGGRICGKNYDRVIVTNCRGGRPCSGFSG